LIFEFFFKDIKTKELNKDVKLDNSKTLYITVGRYLIYIVVAYLNILILKALSDKIITNINMF
jgi:hypothetical protein